MDTPVGPGNDQPPQPLVAGGGQAVINGLLTVSVCLWIAAAILQPFWTLLALCCIFGLGLTLVGGARDDL